MEISRCYNVREGCYNFNLNEGNKIFSITFGGNLDLYWTIYELNCGDIELTEEECICSMHDEARYTFSITKENYMIYSLFEELYDDVMNSRIFVPIMDNVIDNKDYSLKEANRRNEWFKNRDLYHKLFNNGIIEWHSDDDRYDTANMVRVIRKEDRFLLEFICPKIGGNELFYRSKGSASIRFSNSGSTYDPYNIIFMRMFQKLQEYDPKYHQLHMEEILYCKTLKKQRRI